MVLIGYYCLVAAAILTAWSIAASYLGITSQSRNLIRTSNVSTIISFALITFSSLVLVSAFVRDDFSVEYISHYSRISQPILYKLGAFWGGQAGSLLLWVWILSIFSVIILLQNRNKNRILLPYINAIMMFIQLFFLILLIFVNNPFKTIPPQVDGVGLNPQLLNQYMLIHPPTLYIGYVGFAVPFAFAIASLITKKTGEAWIMTTRKWTIFSWFFLGVGILLGSYWAYIELGWGGYWAWDPVENASLIPWLVGTAYLHSVMIQERKGIMKVWNMILIILTFNLCIFGTFITRSGIISSVHAFAESNIGIFFIIFMGITFFVSLLLLIFRLSYLKTEEQLHSLFSKESMFLFNNVILIGMAFTIFLLTVFPIISEWFTERQTAIGPPVYNQVNIPWGLVLLLLVGICPLIAWKRTSFANIRKSFLIPAIISVVFVLFLFFMGARKIYPLVAWGFSLFVFLTIFKEFFKGTRSRQRLNQENIFLALFRLILKNKRRYGGYIIHIGIVLMFIGIAGSSAYQFGKEQALRLREGMEIGSYFFTFDRYEEKTYPERFNITFDFNVLNSGKDAGSIIAELNNYPRFGLSTEVGIKRNFLTGIFSNFKRLGEDLYIIPMGFDPQRRTVSIKAYINPMINWLWIGGIILIIGSLIATLPDREEKERIKQVLSSENDASPTAH